MNIPGYQIEEKLGEGGMAAVYLATQESLKRPVALKVMAEALVHDQEFVKRFIREARFSARLVHPNIAKVFDIGVASQRPYLAMEYIDSGTLHQRMRTQPLQLHEIFSVIRGVASALACAHAEGIIHRDIKPGNILFRSRGSVVLGDFGIAKAMAGSAAVTALTHGKSIGTPNYMSPEQARGQKIDGRSDQYALGTVLYECLTGRAPYIGTDPFAIAFQHIYEPVPTLPEQVEFFQPMIDRLMAKEPADRYADDEEILQALDKLEQKLQAEDELQGHAVLFTRQAEPEQNSLWRTLSRLTGGFKSRTVNG